MYISDFPYVGEEVFLVDVSEWVGGPAGDFYFLRSFPSQFLGFLFSFFSVFSFDCSVCVKFYAVFCQC